LQKLKAKGVHPQIICVLRDWLGERESFVIVDGVRSLTSSLKNPVYQGTVWGPPLWNVFYEDARHTVNDKGFTERIFADDLNCFKAFDRQDSSESVMRDLLSCQSSLHKWGRANQVSFDSDKESFHILHHKDAVGDDFRMLGVKFDTKLLMSSAATEISVQAGLRLRTLLRGQHFFSIAALVRLYKSQVLSFLEKATPALYHAPDFFLAPVDNIQRQLLSELCVSELEAVEKYSLAPLKTRRDIAMLGLIHRVVLGDAPPQFSEYIRPATFVSFPRGLRHACGRHTRQLHDPMDGTQINMVTRSVLGLVYVYNLLPQHVVDCTSVSAFQKKLQGGVKAAARAGHERWDELLRSGVKFLSVSSFQSYF
jgi:hypothetical protein